MSDSNRYIDMSAKEALRLADEHFLLLPDIQREYVWNMVDIEKMFESILDGYPIGSLIFWKTNRKIINEENPNLYYFLKDFEQGKSKNDKAPEVFGKEGDYYIVLDGQQRVTSLNIALYGYFTCYRGGRGYKWDNPNNWIRRELYYNLDFYESDVDDENPPKRFSFLSDAEAKRGNWYKVKRIMAYDEPVELFQDLTVAGYGSQAIKDIAKVFERVVSSGANGLVHYYCISENSYDEALDIFVRVNSTGRKLSKSDLLFSTLIDGWKQGKESIDTLLSNVNTLGANYSFSRDYLMRLMLVLVDAPTNLRIESFDRKTVLRIREEWNNISLALVKMVEGLVSIGLSHGFLTSYNATMPLVYYIYRGGSFKTADDKNEMRKFLTISMANRLFGVASNDSLKKTRSALQRYDCSKTSFKLSLFSDVVLTGNRTFKVLETDIDNWLDNYTIGQSTYTILTLLYPDLKLDQVSFHQDHCHPFASFGWNNLRSLGLSDEIISEWQYKRNLLPNLQFLEGRENESKNMTPLKDWLESDSKHTIEYKPEGVSFELKDFESFFQARRQLIKERLMELFDVSL